VVKVGWLIELDATIASRVSTPFSSTRLALDDRTLPALQQRELLEFNSKITQQLFSICPLTFQKWFCTLLDEVACLFFVFLCCCSIPSGSTSANIQLYILLHVCFWKIA
jgi:hypothetical protein